MVEVAVVMDNVWFELVEAFDQEVVRMLTVDGHMIVGEGPSLVQVLEINGRERMVEILQGYGMSQ